MADEQTVTTERELYDLLVKSGKMVDAFRKAVGREMTEHDRTLAITLFLQKHPSRNGGGGYRGNGGGQRKSSAAPQSCPKCNGAMWDNSQDKRNPRAPDYKCKDKQCDGAVWLDRGQNRQPANAGAPQNSGPSPFDAGDDDLPF